MKKFLYFIPLALIFVFILIGYGVTSQTAIDNGKSEIYTQQDLDKAVEVIKEDFKELKGYTAKSFVYQGDKVCQEELRYCNTLNKEANYTECAVYHVTLTTPMWGGDDVPANKELVYVWHLARTENGEWETVIYSEQ